MSPSLRFSVGDGFRFTQQAVGISPASLKRINVRKNFYNRIFFYHCVINSMPRVTDKEMQAEQDKVMDELMKNLKN